MKAFLRFARLLWFVVLLPPYSVSAQDLVPVGSAQIDITPNYPVRLCGYAVRTTESQGVLEHLFAKALAIGSDKDGPAVLLTFDNTGIPGWVREEVASRLQKRKGIPSDHIALCCSHAHTTPCLAQYLPTLFGAPLKPEEQAHIDRYTKQVVDALEKVALEALKNRQPSRLFWTEGTASFAANRRTRGGPVDHSLPALIVKDRKDHLRAIFLNYACHGTTFGGETNMISGDWAGYAQEYLQHDHPGATVLVALGCAGDANPQPRPGLIFAQQHGREIENSINEMLARSLIPLRGKLQCRAERIELSFDKPRTMDEWQKLAHGKDKYAAYYARVNLAKLEKGVHLPETLPYGVQCWNFGNDLAMVFLNGEVVVDYELRLKREFDSSRLWVNAYANDVPCYIPSERVLKEGGYEGGGAMVYYDRPNRLAPGLENKIVKAVHEVVPKDFVFDKQKAEFPPPRSPEQSLASVQTEAAFDVQLAASEPLIVDPVAIDWGPDGKLWAVEMRDYPLGMDNHWKPGSRVKYLEDTDGDGKYDKATVFVDNLPFVTGVTAWRDGVLICSAPDILFAEDVNHASGTRGKAGKPRVVVKKVFTGFFTKNYQARVNSLTLGLDNWVYGANGLLGGVIRGESTGLLAPAPSDARSGNIQVDIRGRDFRINPDTGEFQPASGLTQQGRVRDDWGNWFGCDNSTLAWNYPLPDQYVRRNPYVAAPSPRVSIASGKDPNLLHPISRTLERFNEPYAAGRVTSACGICVYRDDLFGPGFEGNAFICEPVHNLVHRLLLQPSSVTFSAPRPPDEQSCEFLASRDNWFRPVQARTGPDGALWIVDMYRFVIEHPDWIPAERLAKLDVRAGADKGRIYRVLPKGIKPRPVPDLTRVSLPKLAELLDSPNGTERDRVHQELAFSARALELKAGRESEKVKAILTRLAKIGDLPAVRLQAACVLDGLGMLNPALLGSQLRDSAAPVRANAIRLSEQFLSGAGRTESAAAANTLGSEILALTTDPDLHVRFQLALSLGEWDDPRAGVALGQLASASLGDKWMRAAILSSATRWPAEILKPVLAADSRAAGRSEMIRDLIATAVGEAQPPALGKVIAVVAPGAGQPREEWQLAALDSLLESFDRKSISLGSLAAQGDLQLRSAIDNLGGLFNWAHEIVADPHAKESLKISAIHLLGRDPKNQASDLELLARMLDEEISPRVEAAIFESLKRLRMPAVPEALLKNWAMRPPSIRQAALETLLAREEWVPPLLDALEKGVVGANEISPSNRQRLLRDPNKAVQSRAQALWKNQGAARSQVIAKYHDALILPGDPSKGALVFANTCTPCHFLRGQGHAVGPNLAALADKTPADFLTAILDPNAVVEPRFIAYNIETKDGRSLSGVVSAETATTLTLVQGGGARETILRADIDSIRASGLSLMPEGLEQNLKPQDFADLIAYLKTSPRPFGSADSAQADLARKKFSESKPTGVARILKATDDLPYPGWLGSLPLHYCRQTDGTGKVIWQTAPAPSHLAAKGSTIFCLPVGMGFASNPSGNFRLSLDGKPALSFDVAITDNTWESKDGKVRLRYTVMENNTEDSNGILTMEIDNDLLSPGKPVMCEVTGSASNSQRWFGIYELPTASTRASR